MKVKKEKRTAKRLTLNKSSIVNLDIDRFSEDKGGLLQLKGGNIPSLPCKTLYPPACPENVDSRNYCP